MYAIAHAPQIIRRYAYEMTRPLPVELRDEGDAYLVKAFVPGLTAEDLTIEALDDVVSIEGEYKANEGDSLLNELPSGAFRRALRLPVSLDADKAEARVENGVLSLRLPKAESSRPRTIKVNFN